MLNDNTNQAYINALSIIFPEIGRYKDLPPSVFLFFLSAIVFFKILHTVDIGVLTQKYYSLRKRKFHEIKDRLADKEDADDSYIPLKDKIEAYDFKLATGIYAESLHRKNLIYIHNINPRVITWGRIKSAMSFIEDDAKIRSFTRWEKFERKLLSFFGNSCSFLAIICLLFAGVIGIFHLSTSHQEFVWIGYMILYALSGVFFHRQTWPYISAEKIKNQILEMEDNKKTSTD